MPGSDTARVIVVGAGMAGLACAADLCSAGASVQVLEAAGSVGGRMRTDRRDGFVLDRGFQVFNTSYPQVRRRLSLRDLQLRAFAPGMLLHTADGRTRFADPTRQPAVMSELVTGRKNRPGDLAALAVLSARDMLQPASWIRRGPDESTVAALRSVGISAELIERLFRPFLSGVFLEDQLSTSSRFFHLVWRSMLRGSVCLARHGIRAVPDQLAIALPPQTVRLDTPVERLTGDGVLLTDGSTLPAGSVVVATGPSAAAALLPGLARPATRTVTTVYHAAPASPLGERILLVDAERTVLHTSVLSDVSRSYAPDGYALVSTSVLGGSDDSTEATVRARAGELFETETSGWSHLATYTIADALPAMPAPHPLMRSAQAGPGRYVCGDYRATGSVQGALASGARAAREVLAAAG